MKPVTTYAIRHSAEQLRDSIVDLSAKAEAAMTAHLDDVSAEYGRALIRTEWRVIEPRRAIDLNGATEEVTHFTLIGGPPHLPHETTLARVEFTRSYADGNATWSAHAVRLIEARPEWRAAKLGGCRCRPLG